MVLQEKIEKVQNRTARFVTTPQPLYNTIVGVHSINRVSQATMLYPNKNV